MGRRGPVLLAALTVAALAVGCTSTRSGSDESSGNGATKIGLVTKTDSNPYFVALRDAAKAEAGKNGAELVALAGEFDGDNDGQVAAIENLVQQGAKTILVTPNNSTGILGAIDKARDRGVLVIALDTETDPRDAVDATIATDNTNAGRLQGQYVKAALNGRPARSILLDGTPGSCEGVEAVRSGEIAVTVMQFPQRMAEQGVRFAVEFAETGEKPSGFVETETAVITDEPLAGIDSEDTAWGLENCWG